MELKSVSPQCFGALTVCSVDNVLFLCLLGVNQWGHVLPNSSQ